MQYSNSNNRLFPIIVFPFFGTPYISGEITYQNNPSPSSGVVSSIIGGGAHIHIFMFTDRNKEQSISNAEHKYMNMCPPPQLFLQTVWYNRCWCILEVFRLLVVVTCVVEKICCHWLHQECQESAPWVIFLWRVCMYRLVHYFNLILMIVSYLNNLRIKTKMRYHQCEMSPNWAHKLLVLYDNPPQLAQFAQFSKIIIIKFKITHTRMIRTAEHDVFTNVIQLFIFFAYFFSWLKK